MREENSSMQIQHQSWESGFQIYREGASRNRPGDGAILIQAGGKSQQRQLPTPPTVRLPCEMFSLSTGLLLLLENVTLTLQCCNRARVP